MFMQTGLLCSVRDASGELREFGSYSFLSSEYCGTNVLPCRQGFDVQSTRRVGADALDLICERLRAGQAVTLNTFAERLPFFLNFLSFDATYDPAVNIFPHFILILGISETEIFYVEDPAVLNWRQFVSHPDNRYVGVIKKELLLPALEAFAEIHEIGIDTADVDFYTSQRYLREFFAEELKTRQRETVCPGGWILSCQDILDTLIEIVMNPAVDLFGQHAILQRSGAPNLKTFLSWQFYDVVAAKQMQATSLTYWEPLLESSSFVAICLTHRYSVLAWEKVCRTLNAVISSEAQLGKRALADALRAACDLEQRLARSIASFLEEEAVHE